MEEIIKKLPNEYKPLTTIYTQRKICVATWRNETRSTKSQTFQLLVIIYIYTHTRFVLGRKWGIDR